jgi:tetratricopeptide (TPR) repeat protein
LTLSQVIVRFVCLAVFFLTGGFASDCPPQELAPEDARARFHELDKKAQVEFRHGELAKAAEDFRLGACVAPENLRSYYELYGMATGAAAAGDFAKARQVLQQADQQRPEYPLPLAMMVKLALTAGDVDSLKESLRTAAVRFPADGKLHAEFVKDLLHKDLPDLALAEALRFEQSGTKDAEDTITLGALENNVGAFDDAARSGSAVEQQAELPAAVRASGAMIAGLADENLNRYQSATEHLRVATELAPAREEAYLALARVHEKQQQFQAAIEVLESARKQIPESPKMLLALGSDLVAAGQNPEAVRILSMLVERFPDEAEAYLKLAEAYGKSGDAVRATATLRRLALRQPAYPMIHISIAQTMLAEDPVDRPGVLRELAEAEKLTPGDFDVFYLRGKVLALMNRYNEAEIALRRAVALRPTEPGPHYQLGLAYRKSGQEARARQEFDLVEHLKQSAAP